MSDDIALCGDETCESPVCRQSAIDAYYERGQQIARDYVRGLFGQPPTTAVETNAGKANT